MDENQSQVVANWRDAQLALADLVGLPLSVVRRGLTMRIFHFGPVSRDGTRSWGNWALHLQCPWRIQGPAGIIAGASDIYRPEESGVRRERPDWSYEEGNLLDDTLNKFFSIDHGVVVSPILVVRAVSVDRLGSIGIDMDSGVSIHVFPASTVAEHWRLFQPRIQVRHLVCIGPQLSTE